MDCDAFGYRLRGVAREGSVTLEVVLPSWLFPSRNGQDGVPAMKGVPPPVIVAVDPHKKINAVGVVDGVYWAICLCRGHSPVTHRQRCFAV